MAEVVSINISENRGTVKHEIDCAKLIENYGIEGDAHAGRWHRQISLLAEESIDQMRALGFEPEKGAFAENINTAGIELKTIPIGRKIKIGQCILRVTQIGKECHNDCEIKRVTGKCVMPTDGIFAAVEKGGIIRKGDKITVMEDDNNWLIDTKNAVGHVLGHDITRILKGRWVQLSSWQRR
ncbi:hypothetical protein IMSAG049_00706 [Clostridiales bacterium]|nr:hypothetical protein IMSAG049_00706 [Clostridiales bacterium]